MPRNELIQANYRRGTTSQWSSANPVLAAREIGMEDMGNGRWLLKMGNGTVPWLDLPYSFYNGDLGIGSTLPTSPHDGDKYFLTTDGKLYKANGSTWVAAAALGISSVATSALASGASPTGSFDTSTGQLSLGIPAGVMGAAASTIRPVTGTPAASLGNNGDYAIDSTSRTLYGPKAGGAWPAGVSLAGAQGAIGPAGASITGPTGATGATGPSGTNILGSLATAFTLSNSSVETTVVTTTIPANSLGTSTAVVRIVARGYITQPIALGIGVSLSFTVRVKFGGQTFIPMNTVAVRAAVNNHAVFTLETEILMRNSSALSQSVYGRIEQAGLLGAFDLTTSGGTVLLSDGSFSVDSTQAQTLSVTAQANSVVANTSLIVEQVRIIRLG